MVQRTPPPTSKQESLLPVLRSGLYCPQCEVHGVHILVVLCNEWVILCNAGVMLCNDGVVLCNVFLPCSIYLLVLCDPILFQNSGLIGWVPHLWGWAGGVGRGGEGVDQDE